MSGAAFKKQRSECVVDFDQAGTLCADFCTVKDISALLPELNKDTLSGKEKFIVVRNTHDQHIVAVLPIVDSRDSQDFIYGNKFDSEELRRKYPDDVFLEIGKIQFFDNTKSYRAGALIWQMVYYYCETEHVDYVIGCVSFAGRYPAAHAVALSYLYHFCRAEPGQSIVARKGVSMDIMPEEAIRPQEALRALPAQLRYCLRHGAKVGEGVFVDQAANCSEIFILIPVA